MTFDATHTRESDAYFEALINECHMEPTEDRVKYASEILAAQRRIPTPIPLTPSDEMVAAGVKAMRDEKGNDWFRKLARAVVVTDSDEEAYTRAILQTALNLIGGK